MAERHGLGDLEMGEARHHGCRMKLGLADERRLQRLDRAVEPVDGVAHPELEVGRDLIVARARGVQPAGRRADELVQARLDIEVDILVLGAEGEGSALDLAADFR